LEESTECTIDVLDESIAISNGLVKVVFNTRHGYFSLISDDSKFFTQGYVQVHTNYTVFDSRQMTYKAFSSLDYDENGKTGKAIVIRLLAPDGSSAMNLRFSMIVGVPGYNCRVQFNNRADEEVRVKSIDPLVIDIDSDSRIVTGWNSRDLRFFKNGFHSWELSQAQIIQPGENKSHFYSVINNLKTRQSLVLGFVTMGDQLGTVSVFGREEENNRLAKLIISSSTDNIPIPDAETIVSEEIVVLVGDNARKNLALYIDVVAKKMNAIKCEKLPVGWCSWYFY
jgi:hypothetical protein